MANSKLSQAKNAKNDEFYTQWADIEKEVQAYLEFDPNVFRGKTILCPCDDPEWSNFTKFFAVHFREYGLKKLIATSYAVESKNNKDGYQLTLFEKNDPKFDRKKSRTNGKIFILDNKNKDHINIDDLKWEYMAGDGDFRSDEVSKLQSEADLIITNPPFSLFRQFIEWIMEDGKQFLIIGNKNAITYKEVFPLIKENKIWAGASSFSKDILFISPEGMDISDKPKTALRDVDGVTYLRSPSIWFSNLDHGRRHRPLSLMTMEDNLKYSRHKEIKAKRIYDKYDNYDAIEVPFTDAIPSDYDGVMGVPISFLDKYCPDQFEIVGMCENLDLYNLKTKVYSTEECRKAYFAKFNKNGTYDINASGVILKNGLLEKVYQRILIKNKGINK